MSLAGADASQSGGVPFTGRPAGSQGLAGRFFSQGAQHRGGWGRVGTMRVGRAWRVRYSSRLVKKALIPVSTRLFIVL
ncbi:hypothetical protein QFJ66_03715 [Raoultella terrigena]|uniref:hypothetical protein n=1 Tax=Raoultella terrigena TaxID=577 RepID=UPI002F928EA2